MKTFCLWLAAILFVINLSASGQHRYVEKMLNTENTDSKDALMVDKIGQIILSGYLDGKIKAYRFMVKDSVLKWAEPEVMPSDWSNRDFYNPGERVLFKGKAYEAVSEVSSEFVPTDVPNDFWSPVDLREPLLKRRFYPTEKDTLSKSEFLERMVLREPVDFPAWDAVAEYYVADAVSYIGIVYEAIQESRSIEPSAQSEYWVPTNQGSIEFYKLSDAKAVSVLFNYSVTKTDTTWNPQTVAVSVPDDNIGFYKRMAYFYYDDVMRYLEKVPQPVVNNLANNRLGNTLLVLNQFQRPDYLKWLKIKFKTKAIVAGPKWILDNQLFRNWLAAKDSAKSIDSIAKWRVFQHPKSRDLILSLSEFKGLKSKPFLIIPVKNLEKLYKNDQTKAPSLKNYSTALRDMAYFSASENSHYADSIQPIRSGFKPTPQPDKLYFFIEQYVASLSSNQNAAIAKQIPNVWSVIEKQFYAKALKEEVTPVRYYEDNFDWRKVNPWKYVGEPYEFDEDFNLGNFRQYKMDSIPFVLEFTEILVTYRKSFSVDAPSASLFEPLYVSIAFSFREELFANIELSFNWSALKEQLLKAGVDFTIFINAVETAGLEFYDSELVYGLREK